MPEPDDSVPDYNPDEPPTWGTVPIRPASGRGSRVASAVDPAAVMAAHKGHWGSSSGQCMYGREWAGDVPRCEPYRLAEALAADQDRPVQERVAEAMRGGNYCCQHGCGHGACETCPCCSAGWCVMGSDGMTPFNDPGASDEDRRLWLDVAVEHNPVARALAAEQNG